MWFAIARDCKVSEHFDTKSIAEPTSPGPNHGTTIFSKCRQPGRSDRPRAMVRIPHSRRNSRDSASLGEVEGPFPHLIRATAGVRNHREILEKRERTNDAENTRIWEGEGQVKRPNNRGESMRRKRAGPRTTDRCSTPSAHATKIEQRIHVRDSDESVYGGRVSPGPGLERFLSTAWRGDPWGELDVVEEVFSRTPNPRFADNATSFECCRLVAQMVNDESNISSGAQHPCFRQYGVTV